jgi:flavin-dependent dehydrogenase
MAKGRWVAAGDSAMAFDPLSSVGILAAVSGGQRACDAVIQSFDQGPSAFDQYSEQNLAIWKQYWKELSEQYSIEVRWPEEDFWKRRHSAGRNSIPIVAGELSFVLGGS